MKPVADTHRLMYRNARIRAFDLSDRTTPLEFFNITDNILPEESIGTEVYTDAAGYLYYGQNSQPIQCLAVKQSAIIQVDLHHTGAWDIEWVLRGENMDDFVKVEDVHKVYYANDELAWDPLAEDWHLPDFALKSDIGRGEWAEGEMIITEGTPRDLNIDKWTHVVTIRNGHAEKYHLLFYRGRFGQTIRFMNISDTDVIIVAQHRISGMIHDVRVLIPAGAQSEAGFTDNVGWFMMQPVVALDTVYNIDQPIGNLPAYIVDLTVNPKINRIVVNTAEVTAVYIKHSGDDIPLIEFTNNTGSPVTVRRLVQTGPSTWEPSIFGESVEPRASVEIAVYSNVVRITNGSRSAYVTQDVTTIVNTNVHLLHSEYEWFGGFNISTALFGVWLPITLMANGGAIPGNELHTIKLMVNGLTAYEIETSANSIMGTSTADPVAVPRDTKLAVLNIRLCKYLDNSDNEQITVDTQVISEVNH